jgi:hypothetical protein
MVAAGSFWTGSTEHGLTEGFRSEGWVVQEVDKEHFFPRGVTRIEQVFQRIVVAKRAAHYEAAVLAACRHLRPDVLFTVKGAHLSRRTFETARELGIRTVCFWPDRDFEYRSLDVTALLESDLFVTTKSFQMAWLAERGMAGRSAFVPHGYDPDAHLPVWRKLSEGDYTADIRYIGNYSPAKQYWLEGLDHGLPEANLRLVGNRWGEELPWATASRLVEAPKYLAAEYALAIQTARINVAVHAGKGANGWEDLVSTRTFEIPACGGFMLHIDNDEVREYYEVGTEIDVFSGIDDLVDKCRFYLNHENTRRRMAERARDRCVPAYSYHSRARDILDALAVCGAVRGLGA